MDINDLIPIFFNHKIEDSISTIESILIKGQVIDSQKKRYVFINSCIYNKNNPNTELFNPNYKSYHYKKIYCPKLPYLYFSELLK